MYARGRLLPFLWVTGGQKVHTAYRGRQLKNETGYPIFYFIEILNRPLSITMQSFIKNKFVDLEEIKFKECMARDGFCHFSGSWISGGVHCL